MSGQFRGTVISAEECVSEFHLSSLGRNVGNNESVGVYHIIAGGYTHLELILYQVPELRTLLHGENNWTCEVSTRLRQLLFYIFFHLLLTTSL